MTFELQITFTLKLWYKSPSSLKYLCLKWNILENCIVCSEYSLAYYRNKWDFYLSSNEGSRDFCAVVKFNWNILGEKIFVETGWRIWKDCK